MPYAQIAMLMHKQPRMKNSEQFLKLFSHTAFIRRQVVMHMSTRTHKNGRLEMDRYIKGKMYS